MLLAEHILKMTSPEELFPAGQDECKRVFRELAKIWHPDRCTLDSAKKVFSHISVLYEKALEDGSKGFWDYRAARMLSLTWPDASTSQVPYFTRKPFELGVSYVAKNEIFYVLDASQDSFANNAIKATGAFRYASDRMREEHSKYLPQYKKTLLQNGKIFISTKRQNEFISLRTVLDAYHGEVHSSDVMWILSAFYNITCYLSWAGLVHADISLDSCFIDPKQHMGALLGNWFYCRKTGEPLKQVTVNTASILPWKVRKNKVALPVLDLELVKKLGRDLLGNGSAPDLLVDWLKTPASEDAIATYKAWRTLVKEKFGQKFHKMNIRLEDHYY